MLQYSIFFFFFFQAEDGIRDLTVTGVQTCALPISPPRSARARTPAGGAAGAGVRARALRGGAVRRRDAGDGAREHPGGAARGGGHEIGRASCRGRGEISVGAGSLKKKKKE